MQSLPAAHHDGCSGKGWRELREMYEPKRESASEPAPPVDEPFPGRTEPNGWPADLAAEAFHGFAGDIVRTLEPHTEADPAAILLSVLVGFGNVAGDDAYFHVNADKHRPRLFGIVAGATSKARKGTGWSLVEDLLKRAAPGWTDSNVTSGLSSGEGLISLVRDPVFRREAVKDKGRVVDYQEIEVDPGVSDKRQLVIEAEFGRTLKVAGREGNTLSAVIRQGWDTGKLRVATKNNPLKATGAHIGILGQITKDELLRELSTSDAANGFGNRFLFMMSRRSKLLPEGGRPPDSAIAELGARLAEAIEFAATAGEMKRDEAARQLWYAVYPELSGERPGLFGAMTARAEAQVLRLSLVYALLDLSRTVRTEHLAAALAVWERCEASVKYLFGDLTGDRIADTILRALRSQEEMSETEISNLFGRNVPSEQIGRARALLMEAGLVTCERRETEGRPANIWKAR